MVAVEVSLPHSHLPLKLPLRRDSSCLSFCGFALRKLLPQELKPGGIERSLCGGTSARPANGDLGGRHAILSRGNAA
jgi:hypothetical protein